MVCVGKSERLNYGFHPLMHTRLEFTLPQDIESLNKRSRSSVGCLKSEIRKKFAVLLLLTRRTKPYLTSLNILNNPKVAAAIKVWREQ
jgi:hypothetical protein